MIKQVKIEKYVCCWEDLSAESNKLINFLDDSYDIRWIKNASMRIIDDKKIDISTNEEMAELILDLKEEIVKLKIRDKEHKILIKKENKRHYLLNRICQGDIYKNVEFIKSYNIKEEDNQEIIEIEKIIFPYVIVLSQDCDLAQDFKFRNEQKDGDKILLSVLVAPIYNTEQVFEGTHLEHMRELPMRKIKKYGKKKGQISTEANNIFINSTPRYHYVEFPEVVQIVPSIIDFKHYLSLDLEYLYKIRKTSFVCKISELYREDINQRFASFMSRMPV